MNTRIQRITPFLWFDHQAEEAAQFYVSVFPNSRVLATTRYGKNVAEATRQAEGSVMTVTFELDGLAFSAINGGPVFAFTPAISLVVNCHTQEEIDYYWRALGDGGDPSAQQCGWLKDRYGLSWQVVPTQLVELLSAGDPVQAESVMQAVMRMKKLDIQALQQAGTGG